MTDAVYDPHPSAGFDRTAVTVPPASGASRALERGKARLVILGAVFVMGFAAVSARLVDAMVIGAEREPATAGGRSAAALPAATRADIMDRNGILLATSVATQSVYADPKLVIDPQDTVRKLRSVLPDINTADLIERLMSERRFVWVKRNITPKQVNDINRLGLPGVYFQREERRIYPVGNLAGHIVGFAGVDNMGLMGVEQGFDRRLKSSPEPVQLSIDVRLQHILRREIQQQIDSFNAVGGAGLIMDVRTGEVLSMVSLPDFDPNAPTALSNEEARFNRVTLGVYESGSTFKIFNTAMGLESGKVRLGDVWDASRPISYGRFTINDFRGQNRPLNTAEVFQHSSNIGSVRIAQAVGVEAQREFLRKIGMLKPSPIELPEVGLPMVPRPWREINLMTIAFGHGMAVSPMQLASGVAAMVNGGIMVPATILKRRDGEPVPGERVISPQTSDSVRRLMRLVVSAGTASTANAPGYLVGGKTGTAEKNVGRTYSQNARRSSFVGAFPMNDPRYLVYIMIDEPKGTRQSYGFATGGWVAAPAMGRLVKQIGPLLGVQPLDEQRPEVLHAVHLDPRAPRAVQTTVAN